MATRPPLVDVNGRCQELSTGDTLPESAIPFSGVIASTAWASLPAASSVTSYKKLYFVTDVGQNGSYWFSNGTIWLPASNPILLHRLSAEIVYSGVNPGTIQDQFIIPSGVLRTGSQLDISFSAYKATTTSSHRYRLYLGTAGTTSDAHITNASATGISSGTSSTLQNAGKWSFIIASATTIKGSFYDTTFIGLGGSATARAAAVTIPNISSNILYLTLVTETSSGTETATINKFDVTLQV